VTRTTPAHEAAATRPTAPPKPPWTRDRIENVVFGVLRWVVIAVLVLVTVLPFYYMIILSVRRLDEVVQ
jgi:multiple sugar transport system permease protein